MTSPFNGHVGALRSSGHEQKHAQDDAVIKALIGEFRGRYLSSNEMEVKGLHFEQIILGHDELKARMIEAAKNGALNRFVLVTEEGGSMFSYNAGNGVMKIHADALAAIEDDPSVMNKYKLNDFLDSLGHETQHALDRQPQLDAHKAMLDAVQKQYFERVEVAPGRTPAQGAWKPHDYTDELKPFLDHGRQREARGAIGGFNAVVENLRRRDGEENVSLASLYEGGESARCIIVKAGTAANPSFALRPGITLEKDFSMKFTPENTEAMAKYFVDRPAQVLQAGSNGKIDYRNTEAISALNFMMGLETSHRKIYGQAASPTHLKFKALGLSAEQLSPYLDFPGGKPFVFFDTSSGVPVKTVIVGATPKQEPKHEPIPEPKQEPVKKGKDGEKGGPNPGGFDLGEALGRLGSQRQTDFGTINKALSDSRRWNAEAQHNIAGALLKEVDLDAGMRRIDRVVVGGQDNAPRVFAMYMPNGDRDPCFHASVDANAAARQPVGQSLADVEARSLQASQAVTTELAREQETRGLKMA